MIRLIASDLDGTLLQKDGTLPSGTFELIRELKQKKILFCAASGRQYANLRRLFAPVADEICYISENGSFVSAQGKCAAQTIGASIALPLIQDILGAGMEVLLSIPESSVMLTDAGRAFTNDIFYRLKNTCTIVENPAIYAEQYIKISGFHPSGVAHLAKPLQEKWGKIMHADIAGEKWLDFTLTNKSDGIRILSGLLDVPSDQMDTFGDQFNDLAMLQTVGHPFLMKNAPEGMKKYSFTICTDVLESIRSLID